jgi:hypothetical protein
MVVCQNYLTCYIPLVSHAPMRPNARGLAKHGGPPDWLEESDPAGVILYVMDGPYRMHLLVCDIIPYFRSLLVFEVFQGHRTLWLKTKNHYEKGIKGFNFMDHVTVTSSLERCVCNYIRKVRVLP